jgi:putative membrane protein
MKLLIRVIINAIALWITTLLLPAIQVQQGIGNLLIVAVIFGLVNALIRPIVKVLALPITLVTLGLFTLVINTLMLLLTSWLAGNLMAIEGGIIQKFVWAFVGAIIISLVSTVLSWLVTDDRKG